MTGVPMCNIAYRVTHIRRKFVKNKGFVIPLLFPFPVRKTGLPGIKEFKSYVNHFNIGSTGPG